MRTLLSREDTPISFRAVCGYLALMMVVQFLLHLPFLSKPPMGQHVWRQTVGYAMARNYHAEDSRFWYPRNDIRPYPENNGQIWHELPLVYWLIGMSYQWTGEQPINARLIWFLFAILCVPASYYFARQLQWDRGRSMLYSYCFCFVPYFFYYSITLAPNLLGLMWFLLGFALLLRAERTLFGGWDFVAGISLICLATVSKPTYLFYGLPVAALFGWSFLCRRKIMILIRAGLGGCAVIASNAYVIRHAAALYRNAPLEQQVHTPIGPAPAPENWQAVVINLKVAATTWFGELFIGYAALPLFLVGLWLVIRNFQTFSMRNRLIWCCWMASFGVFSVLFVSRFKEHAYYLTALLPVAAGLSAYGAYKLWQAPGQAGRWVVTVCLALMPIIMVGRTYKRWTIRTQVPLELLSQAQDFQRLIPAGERILVLGDSTPIVFLYYLNRKGLVEGNTVSPERLEQLYERGQIRWLVSFDPKANLAAIASRLSRLDSIGRFSIYQISPTADITTKTDTHSPSGE